MHLRTIFPHHSLCSNAWWINIHTLGLRCKNCTFNDRRLLLFHIWRNGNVRQFLYCHKLDYPPISILFCSLTFPLAAGPFQSKWESPQSPYIRCHGACSCKAIWDHKNYISWRHPRVPISSVLTSKMHLQPFFLHRTFFCSFLCSHLCPRTLHQILYLLPLPFTPLSSYIAPKIVPFATSGFRKCKNYFLR